MATWKDDEIATEALRGVIKARPPQGRRYAFLGAAAIAVVLVTGAYWLRQHPKVAEAAEASRALPVEGAAASTTAANKTTRKTENASSIAAAPNDPGLTTAAVATHPSVAPAHSSPPLIETDTPPEQAAASARSMLPPQARPLDPSLAAAREFLQAGDVSHALEQLGQKRPHPLDPAEEQDARLLLARASLASGNMAEARQRFEALAFTPSGTALGADAMMGNFWCQAGTLARCRDSELEQVCGGPESWGKAVALLERARRADEKSGGNLAQLEVARGLYQQALDTACLEKDAEQSCVQRLTELTDRIVLDPKFDCSLPKAVFHSVEAGDFVAKIARRYKVNQGQIKRINRLPEQMTIRLGQTLKILPGDVVYKVDRTHLHGTLYIGGVFIRRYPVGIGPGDATPVGSYSIATKVVNPDWYYGGRRIPFGDAENILGTRWMGFSTTETNGQGAGLGVHGTAIPESVPGRESKGCVRMHNNDVEELYDFMPQGGKIEIFD